MGLCEDGLRCHFLWLFHQAEHTTLSVNRPVIATRRGIDLKLLALDFIAYSEAYIMGRRGLRMEMRT